MEEDNIAVGGATTSKDTDVEMTKNQESPAAPPSTSSLSDLPSKDFADLERQEDPVPVEATTVEVTKGAQTGDTTGGPFTNATAAMPPPAPGWEINTAQTMNGSTGSGQPSTPAQRGSRGRGRPRKHFPPVGRSSLGTSTPAQGIEGSLVVKTVDGATPASTVRGRGRGRGGGRPRGKGRGGTGRSGKRKRGDDEDEDDEDAASDTSDEVTPVATMTKSGRNIQKPTNFVPPPPSPTTNPHKRKRPYNRRNPESAVCKICLRGTSPAANMIVFCDGCNAPYHRWCHKPPIDQAIIDEVDKEWFCHMCEAERVIPVPEAEVADFVSSEGVSTEARQKYFSSLPPGMLVTLLTKATNLKPDLPLFPPDFRTKQQTNGTSAAAAASPNGHVSGSTAPTSAFPAPQPQLTQEEEGYGPDVHPPNYPRPGQGLMRTLPPEQEDLQWLVEDDDKYGVFTHLYRTGTAAAAPPSNVAAGAAIETSVSTA